MSPYTIATFELWTKPVGETVSEILEFDGFSVPSLNGEPDCRQGEEGDNPRMRQRPNQRNHKSSSQLVCLSDNISPSSFLLITLLFAASLIIVRSALSESETKPIVQIQYKLDGDIASDALRVDLQRKTEVRVGESVTFHQIGKSIELIHATGLFSQVRVIEMSLPNGVGLTFDLTSKVIIGKIEFTGNTLNKNVILAQIVSRPKKQYSPDIAEEDRRRILDLYRNYGYFQARVRLVPASPDVLHRVDLLYSIEEGRRALIEHIKIEGVNSIEPRELESVVESEKGEVYYKQLVDADVRRIQELYRDHEYRTVKVRPQSVYNEMSRGVVLTYEITEGKKIRIEFVGDGIDKSELEHSLLLFTRDSSSDSFSETNLKNTEEQISQIYQAKGYYEVAVGHAVETVSEREKIIRFEIQLGKALRIRQINFEGNKGFSDATLLDQMITEPRSQFVIPGFGWLFSAGIYNPMTLETDKRALELFYRKRGYPDVEITASPPEIDDKDQLVLLLRIREGELQRVDSVSIEGATVFETAQLYSELEVEPGKHYHNDIANRDERSLESLYHREGYIYARINHDYHPQTRALTYKIVEGIQAKFGKFRFDGGGKVKLHVLQREFENLGLVEGAVFDEDRLFRESRRRLLTVGLFREVEIEEADQYVENTEVIDVKVSVAVRKPGAVSVSGGYISSEGIRGTLGLAYNNLFKRNMKISSKISRGTRGNLYEITLIEPWFKLPPIDKLIGPTIATFRLFNDNLEEYEDIGARGGTVNLAKRLGQFGNLAVQYKSQDLRDREDPPKIQTTVSSLGIEYHRDSRDHFLNPQKGWFNEVAIEYAGGFLRGKTSFFKFTTDHRYYRPFWRNSVLASALRFGYEKGLRGNRDREIISFERFYAGGSTSVRGYPERGLGPEDEFGNHRGDVLFILNTELRFPIYKIIGGALFLDVGNVWNKFSDVEEFLPRTAMGTGVRVETPLGPARVDVGVPVMREFKPIFYLQLGQAF